MKTLLILGLLLSPAAASVAQQAPAAAAKPQIPLPPKKSNTILIQRRDSGLVALTALMQGLVNRGYAIKDINREQLTVRTEPRSVSEVGAVIIEGAVRGRRLVLTGAYASEPTSRHSTPIVYQGEGRHDRTAVAWDELVKTAGMLGSTFTYSTQ